MPMAASRALVWDMMRAYHAKARARGVIAGSGR